MRIKGAGMLRRPRWIAAAVVLGVGSFGGYFVMSGAAAPPKAPDPLPPAPRAVAKYTPSRTFASGREVVLVFIGASFCGAHRKPGFPDAVENVKVALVERAKAQDSRFRVMGIALDWDPAEGYAFLGRFGNFDQMAIGDNWLNESAVKYIWRDMPGRPAVPQILVIEREVVAGAAINVRGEKLLKRVAGSDAIMAWAAQHAPL